MSVVVSLRLNIFVNYIGVGAVALSSIIALPWYLSALGTKQFGLIGFIWLTVSSREFYLPEASSLHGIITDNLFWISMGVITVVFVATHILLFFFESLENGELLEFLISH